MRAKGLTRVRSYGQSRTTTARATLAHRSRRRLPCTRGRPHASSGGNLGDRHIEGLMFGFCLVFCVRAGDAQATTRPRRGWRNRLSTHRELVSVGCYGGVGCPRPRSRDGARHTGAAKPKQAPSNDPISRSDSSASTDDSRASGSLSGTCVRSVDLRDPPVGRLPREGQGRPECGFEASSTETAKRPKRTTACGDSLLLPQ